MYHVGVAGQDQGKGRGCDPPNSLRKDDVVRDLGRSSCPPVDGVKETQGFVDGPAISDVNGNAYLSCNINDLLHEVLEDLHVAARELFPPDVELEDLRKSYQAFRTFRKPSDTRAFEEGVSQDNIDIVNRWKKDKAAGGARPGRVMRHRYAQFDELLKPFLRYTWTM